ncbi:MAG TPA: exopolysaccharide biosynthesis polyprenyl glycosylphosphotransferase [Solirubrobacteraceae bacterium]|nr:exopolysaccharide biosynthesis polyprenyl glycosylphosphotransferase [Solirubrobacteraceae bacterium]
MAGARLSGPVVGGMLAFWLARPEGTPFEAAGLTVLALLAGALIIGREPAWAHLLPFMGTLARAGGPLLGAALLLGTEAADALPGLGPGDTWLIVLAAVAVSLISGLLARRALIGFKTVRIAVIGSVRPTDSLGRELRLAEDERYRIVGRIDWRDDPSAPGTGEVARIGSLERLGEVVERHRIDLLLMTGEPPRMAVFDEVARSCLHLPVRLRELSGFYEEVFGHVAVAEINAAWFQWIVHPKYRAQALPGERALDLVVASITALFALPLLAVLALVIKRDGGPIFFKQLRIGEGGKPFTIYKLRTMREGADTEWATADDARVTRIGSFLRRTHLDELPQVLNVLRGEMSVVGPRPEQPAFVDRLERVVPFYQRRHLMKPGLTGWAQVRCGYAGSDIGSAWKVCHDLYYLKHRSVALNLVILGETLRTLVADPQYSAEPASVDFILAPTRTPLDAVPAAASA